MENSVLLDPTTGLWLRYGVMQRICYSSAIPLFLYQGENSSQEVPVTVLVPHVQWNRKGHVLSMEIVVNLILKLADNFESLPTLKTTNSAAILPGCGPSANRNKRYLQYISLVV